MKTALLDVNLLVALAWPNHENHLAAREWFRKSGRLKWSSCPITQAGFIRISSNPVIMEEPATPATACELLTHLTSLPGHLFLPDDVDFTRSGNIPDSMMQGHRLVTDTYLVLLAESHDGYLATLDKKLVRSLAGSKMASLAVSII